MTRHASLTLLVAVSLISSVLASANARSRGNGDKPTALEAELAIGIADLARERIGIVDATIAVTRVELSDVVKAGARVTSLELASRGLPIGWVTAKARVASGGSERELWVKAQVAVQVPTVVAARPIARGAVLALADVRVESRPLGDDRISQVADSVGSQVRTPIEVGQPIGSRDLERLPLVRRGDTVTLVVTGDRFQLKATAEALESGARGEEISLRVTVGQKKVVRGVVTDLRQVELR